MAERNIPDKLYYRSIVTLHFAFQTEAKLYMILDHYVNGGELFYHLKNDGKFSEARVRICILPRLPWPSSTFTT